jgi:hypothetical protein
MRTSLLVFLATWLALPGLAQENRARGEIAVYAGEGHMAGKEGTYGKGAEKGGSFEIRPFARIGFMFDLNRLEHSGSISNVNGTSDHWDINGKETHTSGSVVYHFAGIPLEPYVFGGAGTLRSSRTTKITGDFKVFAGPGCFIGCSPNVQPTRTEYTTIKETRTAVNAGAGIRVPIAWRLSFRPEVRVVRAGNASLVHAVFALSYRW